MHKIMFIDLSSMKYVKSNNNIIIKVIDKNREGFLLNHQLPNVFYLYNDVGKDKESLEFLDYIIKNRTTPTESIESIEAISTTDLYTKYSKLLPDITEIKRISDVKLDEIRVKILTEIKKLLEDMANLGIKETNYTTSDYIFQEDDIILEVLRGKDNSRFVVNVEKSYDSKNQRQFTLNIKW